MTDKLKKFRYQLQGTAPPPASVTGTPARAAPTRFPKPWSASRFQPWDFFDFSRNHQTPAHHTRALKSSSTTNCFILANPVYPRFTTISPPPNTTIKMAGLGSDAQLFEDNFRVHKLSDKKYDRVDRIYATSEDKSIEITLDINNELFPCKEGDELNMLIATSLHYDGTKDDERGWRDVAKMGANEGSLADQYDYVCYGKIYKFEDGEDGQTMYVSPTGNMESNG